MRLTDIGFTVSRPASASVHQAELKLACFTACHTAVDDLGDIRSSTFQKDVKLHRSKCTALINGVIAPCMFFDLIKDTGESEYSLVIDESTDISTIKQLCVVSRYSSKPLQKTLSAFLGLLTLEGGTAEAISEDLVSFLNEIGLHFEKCIGIGTDGCNVMVGKNKSIYTKLWEKNESLVLLKCICHSIQLCASKAMEMLPRNVGIFVSQSYIWFSYSTPQRQKYAEIFRLINNGDQPLKLMQLSNTRWLSYNCCVLQRQGELL
ncbi:UNVERIFIED_CONTAM: hypothetical protein FKN15_014748 [Acipenser sinensis]